MLTEFNWRHLLKAKEYNNQWVRYGQIKADGIRLLVSKTTSSMMSAVTREGKTDFWPLLREVNADWVDKVTRMPGGTALDCELHVPGVQATDIKTLILAKDARLMLTPFALPWYREVDCRDSSLTDIIKCIYSLGLTPADTFDVEMPVDEDLLKRLASERRLEGYVLKQAHYAGWFKLKPVRTLDCFVVDVEKSTSTTWNGGLKSITVAVYDAGVQRIIATVGSGFDGEFRMNCQPDALVGKVCEVSYDSLAGKGRLKFPRFVRWRDDKTVTECTGDQLP